MSKTAIIIGAGPAGLTAAYELLNRSDITPIILEENDFCKISLNSCSCSRGYLHAFLSGGIESNLCSCFSILGRISITYIDV